MPRTIIGLGEILWDVFPDGPRFGGAPANAACSAAELAGVSCRVVMVSGVGEDPLGDNAIDALTSHGVDVAGVQRNVWPTGRVDVTLNEAGMASYRFAEDSAWDHLQWTDSLAQLAASCDAVCFGTLGQRAAASRAIIRRFVSSVSPSALRVLDINLRPPFDDDAVILESLPLANVVKLNDEELPRVARLCGLEGNHATLLGGLTEQYQLQAVALTRGAHGALLQIGTETSDLAGTPVDVVDTVGAGDAYTAAMILGLLAGKPAAVINRHAIAVAAHACTQAGGTLAFPDHLRIAAP